MGTLITHVDKEEGDIVLYFIQRTLVEDHLETIIIPIHQKS